MIYKAVIHYPSSKSEQIALQKNFSSVKAEKMVKYLSSLELTDGTIEQVMEEIVQRRYIYTPTESAGK